MILPQIEEIGHNFWRIGFSASTSGWTSLGWLRDVLRAALKGPASAYMATLASTGRNGFTRSSMGWYRQGLWETLAIYPHDGAGRMQPTQVFTVAIAGVPGEGFSLRDTDDDGRMEVVACETAFTLTASMDGEWPSIGPVCTVHSWDDDLE